MQEDDNFPKGCLNGGIIAIIIYAIIALFIWIFIL